MIANHKGEIPVVILLLSFIAGIAVALSYPGSNSNILLYALTVIGVAFIALNLFYQPLKIYKHRWPGGALITAALFTCGWYITLQRNQVIRTDHFSKLQAKYLLVNITSEPKVKDDVVRFTADVVCEGNSKASRKTSGTLLVSIKDELAKNLFYGEQLLIPAKYSEIEPPYNPGEFNYKRYLAEKNIYHQAYLYPKQYQIVAANKGNPVISYALNVRQQLVDKLKRNMQDTTAIAVASTLILGYKADLSNDVMQAYSKTGTIHILSVSGGHVAIIFALLTFVLGFMERGRMKLLRAFLIVAAIWAYALLTGFSPAACRAAAMISLVIAGKTYSRQINTLNLLAVSAFALLLYDPYMVTDVGFQLSYLAVAGLVIFQPIVYGWLTLNNKWADKLWLACSVSIAAQAITFPLSAYYFHQFPVYFLVTNLLIVVPVTIIMYSGLALLLLPQLPVVSEALGHVLEKSILLMNKMLNYAENAPYASINKLWINKLELSFLTSLIILLFYFIYSKNKQVLKVSLVCLLLLSCSFSVKKIKASNTNFVAFLNVRKHQGIVFKRGNSGVVVTDLAENDKNFQYSIQPCLDSMQITNYTVHPFNSDMAKSYLQKKDALVWFQNKKLLLLNDDSRFKSIPAGMAIDKAYLSSNTYTDITVLNNSVIVDGSNSPAYVDNISHKAKKYALLKRNKALILLSN